jgi:frataxin-like iron-binding protein CyaY
VKLTSTEPSAAAAFILAGATGAWKNTRDGREFFEHLGELIAQQSGEAFHF